MDLTPSTETFERLPLTQQLVLEVLAGRHRCGEAFWTFSTRTAPALRKLSSAGWVSFQAGIDYGTLRAWLTDAGKAVMLLPGHEVPLVRDVAVWLLYPAGCDPQDEPDADLFAVTVERSRDNRWLVVSRGRYLGADGSLSRASSEMMDDQGWREQHTFEREEALARGRELAAQVTVKGRTFWQWKGWPEALVGTA